VAEPGVLRDRAVPVKDTPTVLSWLDPAAVPHRRQVSVVMIVPFAADGEVVAVRLRRGVELPGGHVLPEDASLEDAARREAWEEARITLGPLAVAQVIRVDYRTGPALTDPTLTDPPGTTHIVVYTGRVLRMAPFDRAHESLARMVVSTEDFIDRYGTGSSDDRRLLIAEAGAALASGAVPW
jgi:8-oxo-dGTP diphosphatase